MTEPSAPDVNELLREVAPIEHDAEILALLEEVCRVTEMGFAAVVRVTETRWVACQVLDRIEFGMKPGDELDVATTVCDDVRKCGHQIVVDNVASDHQWRTHPMPVIYGFKSYVSLPLVMPDGRFFGTLCALDMHERRVSADDTVAALKAHAERIVARLCLTHS